MLVGKAADNKPKVSTVAAKKPVKDDIYDFDLEDDDFKPKKTSVVPSKTNLPPLNVATANNKKKYDGDEDFNVDDDEEDNVDMKKKPEEVNDYDLDYDEEIEEDIDDAVASGSKFTIGK
jgi:hypothetical protein